MSPVILGLRMAWASLQKQLQLTMTAAVSYQAEGGGLHDGLECEASPFPQQAATPSTN